MTEKKLEIGDKSAHKEPARKIIGAFVVATGALVVALLPLAGAVLGATMGAPMLIGAAAHGIFWGAFVGASWGVIAQRGLIGAAKVVQAVRKDGFLKTFSRPFIALNNFTKSLRTEGVRKTVRQTFVKFGKRMDKVAFNEAEKNAAKAERKEKRKARNAVLDAEYEARKAEKTAQKLDGSAKPSFDASASGEKTAPKSPVASRGAAPKPS